MKDQCDRIKNRLSAYLDGELSPDDMAEVSAHLESCPDCSALLEKMRQVDEMAGTAIPDFDDVLMDSLAGRIMAGIDEPKPVTEVDHPRPRVIPIWYRYAAVAASVVIVFLAGRMAFKESGNRLLSPPARYEIMTPAAEDTMMPYREEEGAGSPAQIAKPLLAPTPEKQAPVGEHKSAPTTTAKDIRELHGKQAPSAAMENMPAPATMESPSPVEEHADEAKIQIPTPTAREKSAPLADKESTSPGKITGRIVDANTGEPLFGVTVQLKGTTLGAKSNLDGDFTIQSVPPDTYDLTYSSPGYESFQYSEVPVYPGKTEELTVAMAQSVVETGRVTEVRGTRKSIDFLETGTRVETTGETTAAAEQVLADRVALSDVDSLEAQYVSLMNEYSKAGSERSRKSMAYKSVKAEGDVADDLRKVIDSLDTEISQADNSVTRLDVSYLRLRAALDLYRETGKPDDKSRFEGYETAFKRDLSGLQKQGYDAKTLDTYRSRIEQLKNRK